MKWSKIDRFHIQSDKGYSVCMAYLNRPKDIDDVPEVVFLAFPPHQNNTEYAGDPGQSHLNARANIGKSKNLSGAKKICDDHFKARKGEMEETESEEAMNP
ncbi:hypothetical protein Q9L42_021175 (plasmid) [Methylomarinum sp. Ch1-1]|uniref:Uncharacterized protein n=1 Tax=Methylomarinum roseum TaxID=3067653 RepID=A0AAU7P1V8_9GAMM|nr:hypothetical protein [Methylomarinum sp. Ch1-1]MDP4523171.1 hypothetical protein [Methylomarinum sp. Ch1-1]